MLRSTDPLARQAMRARQGDPRAFTEFYRELQPWVARFVARRVDSRADAEELVAEVFRRVVEHLGDFDARRGALRPWVSRIARNAVIDHYRSRKSPVALELVADGLCEASSPLDQLLAGERAALTRVLIAACPIETRRLLALRYGDGLRHAEIAELLGVAEATVRKRLSRALRELRQRSRAATEPSGAEVSHAL